MFYRKYKIVAQQLNSKFQFPTQPPQKHHFPIFPYFSALQNVYLSHSIAKHKTNHLCSVGAFLFCYLF